MKDGSLSLDIQPSGAYPASFPYITPPPVVEVGQVTVTDGFVTLHPNGPTALVAPSEFVFMTLAACGSSGHPS